MASTEDKLRKAKEEIHTSSVTDNMYKNQTELSNKSHAAEMERAGALIDPAYDSKEDAEHYAELAKEYAERADNATQSAAEALERANEAIAHSNAAIATINDKAAVVTESINTKADEVTAQATNAAASATAAATSATESTAQATLAKSYAQGGTGTRENEDLDNVVYYYEQIVNKLGSLQGALHPMGTITFEQLTALVDPSDGDMYNISDEFTSDATFKDGAGVAYGAGTNVYRTADGYWDALPSACVAGIKGDKELTYRKGNVNMTPSNLGAVASDGGNVTNTIVTLENFIDYTSDQLEQLSSSELHELMNTWMQTTNYLEYSIPSSASLKDYLAFALNGYVYHKFLAYRLSELSDYADTVHNMAVQNESNIAKLNTDLTNVMRKSDVLHDSTGTALQPTTNYTKIVTANIRDYRSLCFEVWSTNAIGMRVSAEYSVSALETHGALASLNSAQDVTTPFKTLFLCNGNGISIVITGNPVHCRIFGIK